MKKYSSFFLLNLLFIAIPFISHAASTTTIRLYPVLDGFNQLYDTEGITSWPVARSYTGSLAHDPLISDIQTAHRADRQSGFYRIYRSSTIFDTSIIPDNAKIESATMFVYKGFSNNNGQNLVLTTHTHASTTTLTKSDWYLSNYGSELARGALSTSSYTSFVFNATGTSYINTSGYTDIGGMQDNDFDDIDIGGAQSGVTFYSSDASGTSTDPYLEITYSVEPTTTRIYPTDDGFLQLYDTENQTNWSSARSYTGTFANGPFDINDQVAHRADKFGTGGKYRIYRSTALFDTSVIPNNAVIASSTMYLYKGYSNNEGTHDLVLTEHTRASSTAITKGDWYLSNFGSQIGRGSLISGQYAAIPLNATGTSYLNLAGYTDIGGMQDNDYDNIDIGASQSGVTYYSSDATGTNTDPYLEVTYYNFFD